MDDVSNLVSGSVTSTGTGATTVIAAPSGTRRLYIKSMQIGRTDAGSSPLIVTLNDDAATVLVVPVAAAGPIAPVFLKPLTVAAATALTATSGTGVTTLYITAQGFSGN